MSKGGAGFKSKITLFQSCNQTQNLSEDINRAAFDCNTTIASHNGIIKSIIVNT